MKIQEICQKYKSLILYVVFGVLTTAVNTLAYLLCFQILGWSNLLSTAVAWFTSVLFAFFTNKLWVFGSKSFTGKILIRELISFFSCRIATGALDMAIMYIAVDKLALNELLWKLLSNIIVIVLNYIASKLLIFKPHSKDTQ